MHFELIIGHTKKAPGAFSRHFKQSEYVYNTDLTARTKREFEALGHTCNIRTRDVGGIAGAFKAALKTRPKAIIEFHYNAANGKASGSECLYADHHDVAGLKELLLAKVLAEKMAKALGITNRGAKSRGSRGERGFQNLAQTTNIASVLIETGFGDNPVDAKAMIERKSQLAKAIATGTLEWVQMLAVPIKKAA